MFLSPTRSRVIFTLHVERSTHFAPGDISLLGKCVRRIKISASHRSFCSVLSTLWSFSVITASDSMKFWWMTTLPVKKNLAPEYTRDFVVRSLTTTTSYSARWLCKNSGNVSWTQLIVCFSRLSYPVPVEKWRETRGRKDGKGSTCRCYVWSMCTCIESMSIDRKYTIFSVILRVATSSASTFSFPPANPFPFLLLIRSESTWLDWPTCSEPGAESISIAIALLNIYTNTALGPYVATYHFSLIAPH